MLNNIYFKLINSFLVQVYKKMLKNMVLPQEDFFGTLRNLKKIDSKLLTIYYLSTQMIKTKILLKSLMLAVDMVIYIYF